MKLVFATHNTNKFDEVKVLLPASIELLSLTDLGCHDDIPETAVTLKGNAQIKADFVTDRYGLACFADDTGLLVDALDGAPGVHSARYAGAQKNADDNMNKLLSEMKDQTTRSARFETVIALNYGATKLHFTGVAKGQITKVKRGKKGFGYDPIFRPDGFDKTFAELSLELKNEIGHRGKAIRQLVAYLHTLPSK